MNPKYLSRALSVALVAFSWSAYAADDDEMVSVTSTLNSADELVAAIKSYAGERKWLYFGDAKVKNGEVTLVKVCIPAAAKELFAAGPKASVVAPCGNLSIYTGENGETKVALLNAKFMNVIYPDEHLKKAGEISQPLLKAMVDTVTK